MTLPVLPIKNTHLFPNLLMPLSVGRPKSIAAIQYALKTESREILVVTQRNSEVEAPEPVDLFPIATKAVIKRSGRNSDGKFEILVLGLERVELGDLSGEDFFEADYRSASVPEENSPEIEALHREVVELATKVLKHANVELPNEFARMITNQGDPLQLT